MVFAVFGLMAVTNFIGIYSVLMVIVHTILLCTVAYFTASSLCIWILSLFFLLAFNVTFTQDLMVCCAIVPGGTAFMFF